MTIIMFLSALTGNTTLRQQCRTKRQYMLTYLTVTQPVGNSTFGQFF